MSGWSKVGRFGGEFDPMELELLAFNEELFPGDSTLHAIAERKGAPHRALAN